MSSDQSKLDIAYQAERDLNSAAMKTGVQEGTGYGGKDDYKGQSDSARESGFNEGVTEKFPGSTVETSSREIPPEQGGGIQKGTGKVTKQADFDQGEPGEGPDDVAAQNARNYGGDNDVVDEARGIKAESNKTKIDE